MSFKVNTFPIQMKRILHIFIEISEIKKKTLRLCTVHKGLKKTIRALKLNRAYIILRSF